ncbi:hypothetical protein [Pelagibaculum spongiae]|uniref:Phytase-like domain-containing protein n=1 Tax=Pelagibaculum spongiae TaxID=2080658 RepID=A0A2V1GY18_9GAMM|nr:hypothetical protein [Pelagibaculum spongiae]PVZ71984.1 hypothetical protein DC094_02895 [Pelagibaculum spongiae]
MKKLVTGLMLSLAAAGMSFSAMAADMSDMLPKYEYKLKSSFEVAGRQGVAANEDFIFVSGSKSIFKYDKQGKLMAKNLKPFKGYPLEANHIGDIDVVGDDLYISAEFFVDGAGKDIQIAVHDAKTLKFKRSFAFDPASGQREVAALAVDRIKNTAWMCSWVGGESGRYIYEYDLTTGKYLRKVHMQPVPQYCQGMLANDGDVFLTADDGIADDNAADNMYRVNVTDQAYASVVQEKKFTEVKQNGEIEGLTIDPTTGEMMVLFNRGKRVVLGMPKGHYPRYDREIHEVYVYERIAN